ncbi:MAG: hypothetical protein QF448_08215, partial [Candidatus Thalassarchaeaceae archaeon]|nr:hypothetical protein [Candidatus Thalassarchaeaceae archaeon]
DHRYQAYVEKDDAVLDGIDVSGAWNRMWVPREVTEYDFTFLDRVTDLSGGESMGWCYECAECIGVCPVDNVGSYGPRKLYRKLQIGLDLFDHPGSALRRWT